MELWLSYRAAKAVGMWEFIFFVSRLSPYESIIRLTGELMSHLYLYVKAINYYRKDLPACKAGSQKIKKIRRLYSHMAIYFIIIYKMEFYELNTNTILIQTNTSI